jgi:hypothetical protein
MGFGVAVVVIANTCVMNSLSAYKMGHVRFTPIAAGRQTWRKLRSVT